MPGYAAINRSRRRSRERKLSFSSCSSSLNSSISGSEIDIKGGHECDLCGLPLKSIREHYVCGHDFHIDCIWRWTKQIGSALEDQCPICGINHPSRTIKTF